MTNKVLKWVLAGVDAVFLCFIYRLEHLWLKSVFLQLPYWEKQASAATSASAKSEKQVKGHDEVQTLFPLRCSRLYVLGTWSPKPFAVLLARRAPSVVAVSLAVVAGEAVLGVSVRRAGGGEASAVLRQVAVPCLGPTDAACCFQLRETQMAVHRLSEESTIARQQTRRRLGGAVTQLASVGCLRRGLGERHVLGSRGSTRLLHTGLLLGVCSWWRCSKGSCIPRQADRTRDHYQTSTHLHFFGSCD